MLTRRRFIRTVLPAVCVVTMLSGCGGPEPVKAPTSFSPFTLPDKTVAGIGPDGWKKHESGVQGGMQSSVRYEQGTAEFSVSSDLQGSLAADISKANNAQMENVAGMLPPEMQANMPATVPPVEKLHAAAKGALEKKYEGYDEKPMQPLQSSLGDGRVSEWTGEKQDGLSKYKVHGYRATVLSNERRVIAVCRCTETDWATLSPGFTKILQSLANGGG